MTTSLIHVWKPSSARIVTIDSFVPVPRGTSATVPALLSWPTKDPADTLDYLLDIAPALIGNPGDSISTVDVTVSPNNPGDVVVTGVAADGCRATFWFSGGQGNTTYTVTISVGTISGRTLHRSILLPVIDLSVVYPPSEALATETGAMVTDQNGNPILAPSPG